MMTCPVENDSIKFGERISEKAVSMAALGNVLDNAVQLYLSCYKG